MVEFIIYVLLFCFSRALRSYSTPRNFVESIKFPGSYTVMPILGNKMLDFPFHFSRLLDGLTVITKDDPVKWTDQILLKDITLEEINNSVGNRDDPAAIVTIAMYKNSEGINVKSFYSSMDQEIFTLSINSKLLTVNTYDYIRTNPQVKDINWPIERKIVEAKRINQDVDETILVKNCEYFTEGLVSNFFVINENHQMQTCPDNFVLSGSMAKLIKAIAHDLGYDVLERPPKIEDLPKYKAAFLCSSCKPIQLVSSLYDLNGNLHVLPNDPESSHMINKLKNALCSFFSLAIQNKHKNQYGSGWKVL